MIALTLGPLLVLASRSPGRRGPRFGATRWPGLRPWGGCRGSSSGATSCASPTIRLRCALGAHVQVPGGPSSATGGYVAAGHIGIHMDDCWEEKHPPRDPKTGRLRPNATRFPSGLAALGDYIHSKGRRSGCTRPRAPVLAAGILRRRTTRPSSLKTFAEWGVDYMKVDGCGPKDYYAGGYKAMGEALQASGRDIVPPAHGLPTSMEATKPSSLLQRSINDGCNLWRNWSDIQCNWVPLVHHRALGHVR